MENLNFLSLSILIFAPLFMGLFILNPFFPNSEVISRRCAKGFALLHFIYASLFLMFFDTQNFITAFDKEITVFQSGWISKLGISASLGLNGLSILLIGLTSFLFLVALIISKYHIKSKFKFYYGLMLFLESAILGVFCARDMFLFFTFWELELIPMYFLISQFGSQNSKKSAMKFLLYTFLGSIFMLLGMLLLYFYTFYSTGVLTSNIDSLNISEEALSIPFQSFIFACFFIGFAVKLPIIPFHTWLPDAHADATTPVSIILAGILLKMGAYGLIIFNMQIFPEIVKKFAPILIVLGLINLLWAAFLAYCQTDIKKIIAYSSISHMGIILLGLGSLTLIGLNGAIFQMIAHGFISAGLFMIAGAIYLRTKTREISVLGGFSQIMPKLYIVSIPIILASMGVPLLMGFPAEFMSFLGVFNSDIDGFLVKIIAILAIFGMFFTACYILKFFHKIFFSNPMEQFKNIRDICTSEFAIFLVICCALIFFGVFPNLLIDYFSNFTGTVIEYLQV